MSSDIKQVYTANPSTVLSDNDLLYLGKSPYASGDDSAIKSQDIFPANSTIADGQLAVFNGTTGKKLKGGALTIATDSGNASPTTSSQALNLMTGTPGGCGASVAFVGGSNTVSLQVSDNSGNLYLGAATGGTAGQHNSNFGNESFDSGAFAGSHNTGVGRQVGTAYTGSESSNILIRNTGVTGDNHVIRIGEEGTGNGQQNKFFAAGIKSQDSSGFSSPLPVFVDSSTGQLGFGSGGGGAVTFENNIYIADNGNDTTGDGSLSAPFLTGTKVVSVITAASPSTTNRYYVNDLRIQAITENLQLLPFVYWKGAGSTNISSNFTLSSLFSSIATDSFSYFGGYDEMTGGSITLDFSALSLSHQVAITLFDFKKVPIVYQIIGNDGANFNNVTFIVNEINFNTSGRNQDGSTWRATATLNSGVTRRIRYSDWQCSSITKSLGLVSAITALDVAFCGALQPDSVTGSLSVINSGGASNQPMIKIWVLNSLTGFSQLSLDITNDGASTVDIFTDISTGYFINSANSLVNVTFGNFSNVDHQTSTFVPTNYTPTSYDDDGFTVTTNLHGAQLNGIDLKLGSIIAGNYPPAFVNGLELTCIVGLPSTVTISPGSCFDSANLFVMASASPISLDITTSGAGGLDTGSYATDTWYAIYLIEKSTTSAVSGVFSANFSAPDLSFDPTYNKYRYLGSTLTPSAGTNLLHFYQRGNSNERTYYWEGVQNTILNGGTATTPTALPCGAAISPVSLECVGFNYNFNPGTATGPTNSFYLYGLSTDVSPVQIFNPGFSSVVSTSVGGITNAMPLDSSQNCAYSLNSGAGGANLSLSVIGYKEYI